MLLIQRKEGKTRQLDVRQRRELEEKKGFNLVVVVFQEDYVSLKVTANFWGQSWQGKRTRASAF